MSATSPQIVKVLLPRAFDRPFDYKLKDDQQVRPGQYVHVPLGSKSLWGVVWSTDDEAGVDVKKLKYINEVSTQPPMPDSMMHFIEWVADYTMSPRGNVLAMTMPVKEAFEPEKPIIYYSLAAHHDMKVTPKRERIITCLQENGALPIHDLMEIAGVSREVVRAFAEAGGLQTEAVVPSHHPGTFTLPSGQYATLTPAQRAAADTLNTRLDEGFSVTLLDGVTGSGKTEVYFDAIGGRLRQDRQVLVLLPEIVLTNQFVTRFSDAFGFAPTVWHSGLTHAQRRNNWRAVASGEARLVVGARSALFLPYKELGLMIVDEEHETSYKQEDGVLYHARDMAVVRGQVERCPVVLVSASPSVETMVNVRSGKYEVVHLRERFGEATLPGVELIDMREQRLDAAHFISEYAKQETAHALAREEQVLYYLNRRGFAPLTLCRRCGYRFESPEASSWMVLHTPRNGPPFLMCHHSGFTMPLPPTCPECGAEDSFAACGPGVERLEKELWELFPDSRIAVMASDAFTTPHQADEMVQEIASGEVDIIVGTQMVAKGHNFPNLTRVVIVDADMGLEGGDLRASERTFQLLHQVGGRAGRASLRGKVLVQTFQPSHAVMQALVRDDREAFIESEIVRREMANLPPFSRLAALILSSREERTVSDLARQLARQAPSSTNVDVLGPAPAPIYRLRGEYRQRLLIISPKNFPVQKYIRQWLDAARLPRSVKCKIDIDPQSFM